MKPLAIYCSLFLLTTAAMPLAAQDADPVQIAAAKTFADRKDSTVKLTVTRKVNGKDRTFEIDAVSFDGKGLLVTSLAAIESRGDDLIAKAMAAAADQHDGATTFGKAEKGDLTRVAMFRADSTEAEGDLVLTDEALDLAFIRVRPSDGAAVPLPAAPPAAASAPALLENVLATGRNSPEFQRAATAQLRQIAAIITTPRACYILSDPLSGGTAVFNLRGELLGIATDLNNQSVIVPSAAIAKLAATIQAK